MGMTVLGLIILLFNSVPHRCLNWFELIHGFFDAAGMDRLLASVEGIIGAVEQAKIEDWETLTKLIHSISNSAP